MSKYAPHKRSGNNPRAASSTVCQRCLGTGGQRGNAESFSWTKQCIDIGHFIFECKSTRPYVSRPSRTEQLAKVSTLDKARLEGKPSVEVPDEFKTQYALKTLAIHLRVLIVFATTRKGTANKLLEAKEKERAKDKPGESSASVKPGKRRRRYA